jgi:hypothetical protein
MNYVFDGCTEVLLNQIIESSPEGCPEAESLLEQLSEFQKVCIGTGLCPKGELIRGYMCRHFLRDAVQRMIKLLSTVKEDAAISSIVERTQQFIEEAGEETEAERAYIVVRNLVIVSENIAKQTKKQMIPITTKQPVQMLHYHIDLVGFREFEGVTGFTWEKEMGKLLNPKLPPMSAKQNCENRYRHLFFNLLVRPISIKEMGKEHESK